MNNKQAKKIRKYCKTQSKDYKAYKTAYKTLDWVNRTIVSKTLDIANGKIIQN